MLCNESSPFERVRERLLRRLWISEELIIELYFVSVNPHSFQMAECVRKIWKAYLESIYIINDVFSVI